MASALNTNVNGSSGTCRDGADWLKKLAQAGRDAGGAADGAKSRAGSGWTGPASDEFQRACDSPSFMADDLDKQATTAGDALRTFADRLDTVAEKMNQARSIAAAAGVRIEEPFIIKPQQPMPPARLGGSTNPSSSPEVLSRNRAAYEAYNAAAAEYNAQAEAYNQAKRLVEDARRLEGQAHHELRAAMTKTTAEINAYGVIYGFVTKATAYTSIAESGRATQIQAAERFGRTADIFTRAALGEIGNLTTAQTNIMRQAAEKSGANRDQALKRAKQFETFLKVVPPRARTAAAAHYGRGDPKYQKSGHQGIPKATAAGRVFKSLPYVGSVLVIGNEMYGAATGEQSWGKAAVDSGAQLGGAALGGSTGVWLGGIIGGPPGMLIGGIAGGIFGGMAGQDVVDIATGVDNGFG